MLNNRCRPPRPLLLCKVLPRERIAQRRKSLKLNSISYVIWLSSQTTKADFFAMNFNTLWLRDKMSTHFFAFKTLTYKVGKNVKNLKIRTLSICYYFMKLNIDFSLYVLNQYHSSKWKVKNILTFFNVFWIWLVLS